MKFSKTNISIILVIIFHLVGLTGFLIPFLQPLFLQIVPAHLLLMLFLLFINHHGRILKLILFFLIISILGFSAEWVGVHKQWLFGHYIYDTTLGFKLSEIPLMIGVNWFLLVYSVSVLTQKLPVKTAWLKIISGAGILVLLDLLIEPVAIHFHYWHWFGTGIPLKNYICWFLLSAVFVYFFRVFNFRTQNWVAPTLLIVQFIFFMVLNFA
ncbi:carotenoid biosynthesis protein [Mucilaginibacter sp.]|uniref:carotenoid biosynthesis protein n=1 Tax=Mucilaginibacter sp. TaxID=1882438 RepID=UPI003B0094A7